MNRSRRQNSDSRRSKRSTHGRGEVRRERLFGLTFMAVATAGMAIFIWLNYLSVRSLSDSPSPLAILG
ncbi:MAG: hypothetical protein ACYC6I_12035, partial [Bacillota bacterium]